MMAVMEGTETVPAANGAAAPKASSTQQVTPASAAPTVEEIAAAILDSSRANQPKTIIIREESKPSNDSNVGLQSLVFSGIAFVGLPLWLLLTSLLYTSPRTPMATVASSPPVATTTMANTPSTTSASAVVSQPITKAEVRKLFDLWNDALHTGDPATVAKRYAKEGVLLPTLSDVPRTDVEGEQEHSIIVSLYRWFHLRY